MNTLRFSEKNDTVVVTSRFIPQGTEVIIKHNSKPTKIFVSDESLIRNISEEIYQAFNTITNVNKERKSRFDFNKITFSTTPVKSSIEYLQNYPTTSYIDLWRTLKSFNAISSCVISTFNWFDNQEKSKELIQEPNIVSYIQKTLEFISTKVSPVMRSLCYKLLETLRFIGILYPKDKKINISYGIDIPVVSEIQNVFNQNKKGFFIVFILLVILIVLAVIAYKKSHQ
jgi:hypothetical protein